MHESGSRYDLKLFILELVMILCSLIIIVPLLVMVLGSFKTVGEAANLDIRLPNTWMFSNYVEVFRTGNIALAMKNSIIIVVFTVFFTILFSSVCAFILVRRESALTGFLAGLFSLGLIVPGSLIPTVYLMQKLHLMNKLHGVVILGVGTGISWSLFIFIRFMKSIPREMDESAVIDGCGPIIMFYRIIFPLLKPVIATNIVIIAMSTWNDFITPIYFLNSSKYTTMPLTVYNFFGRYRSHWNLVFADLVLTALPVTILYLYCQKYVVAGMTAGAVKG